MTQMKKIFAVILVIVSVSLALPTVILGDARKTFTDEEIDQWIIATSLILNWNNHRDVNMINRNRNHETFPTFQQNIRELLTGRSWNIHNGEELTQTVNGLIAHGHHQAFLDDFEFTYELMGEIGVEGLVYLVEEGIIDGWDAAHLLDIYFIGLYWEEAGIIAWDLFRVGNLVTWGYIADFITRQEMRELMLPAIHLLREHFNNWEDAVENYLDGLLYWRGGFDEVVNTRIEVAETMLTGTFSNRFDDGMFE